MNVRLRQHDPCNGRAALLRGFDIWRRGSAALPLLAAMNLLAAGAAMAATNDLSDAEIQGRQLAQQLLEQQPATNFTQTGVLKIRDSEGKIKDAHISVVLSLATNNWESSYLTTTADKQGVERLIVSHRLNQPNQYFYGRTYWPEQSALAMGKITPEEAAIKTLAGSDFSLADLGLEFFHWPEQKVLPNTTSLKRSRAYTLLESTNPNSSTNGYSRVLSWIDKETGGILEAGAYDAKGKLLKEFAPKSFKKVNGQWELQEMEIRNVQTGSRTRLDFDLKKQ